VSPFTFCPIIERRHYGKHVIVRYETRKLYSRKRNNYIAHQDILDMMAAGEKIVVLADATGEDITIQTLRSILAQLITTGEFADLEVIKMVERFILSRKSA